MHLYYQAITELKCKYTYYKECIIDCQILEL